MAVKDEANAAGPGLLPPTATATGTARVLLETAVVLFARRGYHGVSVRDITAAVGIRPASLYGHYASKERLLDELMRLGNDQLLGEADAALGRLSDGATPTERLRAIVRSHVRVTAEYPLLARVCTNELHGLSGEGLSAALGRRVQGIDQLATVLREGVEAGEFAVDDVFLATIAIGSMVLRVASWYGGNEVGMEFGPALPADFAPAALYPVDQVADAYADLALRMVAAP